MPVLSTSAGRPIRFSDGRIRFKTASGSSDGSGSGVGSGAGFGSGSASAYSVPTAIPLGLMPHGAALPAGSVHTSWPGFAAGHFNPATMKLMATPAAGGAAFEVQADGFSLRPDGSAMAARVAFPVPASIADGVEAKFTVAPVAGTRNTTALITPATLVAAKDVTLKSYGGDAGSTVYVTSLREIVTNGPRDTWGSNPIQGWDVPVSGPTEVMVRGWRMLHDSSQALSTGYHGWVRAWIYLSYRIDGTYEAWSRVEAGNWDFAVANGAVTVGGTSWQGMLLQHELWDGGILLGAWGGPNDARTVTVAASTFNVGTNTWTRAADFSECQGVRFAAASGGTLPGGLTAGTTYWLDGNGALWTSRNASTTTPNATGTRVTLGAGGSGGVVATPMVGVFNGNANTLLGTDARPIRIGTARVETTAAWDEAYMARGAKLFPRYDQSFTRYPSTAATAPPKLYYPNQMPWGAFLSTTGDNPGDNRIGPVNHCALLSLLNPHDQAFARQARVQAAGWSDQCIWWSDPRSGRPLALGNGPDDVGGTFANMGPNRPGAKMNGSNDNWCGGAKTAGYYDGYSAAPMDGSHMPTPWPVPAFMTGGFEFADQGLGQTLACEMYADYQDVTLGSSTYYRVLGIGQQTRGSGWLLNSAGYAEIFTPSTRPEAALLSHIIDRSAAFYATHLATWDSGLKGMGFCLPGRADQDADPGQYGGQVGFFWDIWNINVSLQARRGGPRAANWLTYLQTTANIWAGIVNDASPTGGSGYVISGNYHCDVGYGRPGGLRTIRQMLHDYERFQIDPPYPATGMLPNTVNGNGVFLSASFAPYKTTDYAAIKLALLGVGKELGLVSVNGDSSSTCHDLLRTRLNTAPCTGIEWSTGTDDTFTPGPHAYPVWAIVTG